MTRTQAEYTARSRNEKKDYKGRSFVAERVDNHIWEVVEYLNGSRITGTV